jgi:hypothetical protein
MQPTNVPEKSGRSMNAAPQVGQVSPRDSWRGASDACGGGAETGTLGATVASGWNATSVTRREPRFGMTLH